MTKVKCTYVGCQENGSSWHGKRGEWAFRFCKHHEQKMRPIIEQTGQFKPQVKLNPPMKEIHGTR